MLNPPPRGPAHRQAFGVAVDTDARHGDRSISTGVAGGGEWVSNVEVRPARFSGSAHASHQLLDNGTVTPKASDWRSAVFPSGSRNRSSPAIPHVEVQRSFGNANPDVHCHPKGRSAPDGDSPIVIPPGMLVSMESLILAQDERWRRASYMQVEREARACPGGKWRTGEEHVRNLPWRPG
jgi:hypothetical protein